MSGSTEKPHFSAAGKTVDLPLGLTISFAPSTFRPISTDPCCNIVWSPSCTCCNGAHQVRQNGHVLLALVVLYICSPQQLILRKAPNPFKRHRLSGFQSSSSTGRQDWDDFSPVGGQECSTMCEYHDLISRFFFFIFHTALVNSFIAWWMTKSQVVQSNVFDIANKDRIFFQKNRLCIEKNDRTMHKAVSTTDT